MEEENGTFKSGYSGIFYLLVAGILGFITMMCFVFLVKSYKAGVKIGEVEGAMSSLSIVVAGIMTVLTISVFANFI